MENKPEDNDEAQFCDQGKTHPLILDVKLPSRTNLVSVLCIRLLNVREKLGLYNCSLEEHRLYNRHNPCWMLSLVSIPISSSLSEVLIENLRYRRTIRSASDLVHVPVELASAISGSGDVMVTPSFRFIFDSLDRTVKGSLFPQLGTLGAAPSPSREETLFTTSPMKTQGITGSPFRVYNALLEDPDSEAYSSESKISDLKPTDRLIPSCSSPDSNISYQSNSSPSITISRGIIYCVKTNASFNLLFKEDDSRVKVYVANLHKVEASLGASLDYLYILCSITDDKVVEYVGKMKVFSSVILNPDRSKSLETEFVLFGVEDRSKEVTDSTTSAVKNKCLSKKVSNFLKSNHSFKQRDRSKISESAFQPEKLLHHAAFSKFKDSDELNLVSRLDNGFQLNHELAAILVRGSPNYHKKDAKTGGWGLKFLEKVTKDDADTSVDPLTHSKKNGPTSWTSIEALIPAGIHGRPIAEDTCPSSLTERWRSGGHCDCGGWDVGCPLTILSNKNSHEEGPVSKEESQQGKEVYLFMQGAKHSEAAIRIVTISETMYTMYFHRSLSVLQAFSIGVALVHSQTQELHPKL